MGKRMFDIFFSGLGLILLLWLIIILWFIASIETKSNGLFFQKRVGKNGTLFSVVKIKTMRDSNSPYLTSITALEANRITILGKFIRKLKLDELPQLWNVLCGHMSFVGPRPDVPGYADRLKGEERLILKLRPGITGPASLKYKNEEEILRLQQDPKKYNDEVIWPDKVKINLKYYKNHNIASDLCYILQTLGFYKPRE